MLVLRAQCILFSVLLTTACFAQYRGGHHHGFDLTSSVRLNELPTVTNGGPGDGFYTLTVQGLNTIPSISFGGIADGFAVRLATGLNELPPIYKGGSNDGIHSITVINNNILPEMYSGGASDGFDLLLSEGENVLPGIFTGGADDGYDVISRTDNNLPCSDDLFVWTGELNEQWHEPQNWECRVAPGLFSQVIIPEGITSSGRSYPVVYLASEVSTITLRSGAYLQVEPGVILKLNGN